ncbi:hypothetical protein SRABI89_04748 [Pseudomonas koreensis]|nr:hypothetical protein SRABI89_04748 [Pseudomonas koreensis]
MTPVIDIPLWRGDLSPSGCEAAPIPANAIRQKYRMSRFQGCSAAQRG